MLSFVVFLILILLLLPLVVMPLITPGQRFMERQFQINKDELIIVRDFIASSEFESISIQRPPADPRVRIFRRPVFDGPFEMSAGLGYGRIPIENKEVLEALHSLFHRGFPMVSGGGGDGNIVFLRWRFFSEGRGIVYSLDGSTPEESRGLTYLVEIEPMSEEGWYFYVDNFNVWRARNRER